MIKNYILDTNVLLQDPEAIYNFEDNTVIIPIGVIEELDKFKKDNNELGRNARQISRHLDELRVKGDLRHGITMPNGGTIKVRYNGNLESFYKEQNIDLHVIHIAQETIKKEATTPCIIVSRDINVRIRANALGLLAEDYEAGKVNDDIDFGFKEIEVDIDVIVEMAEHKFIPVETNKIFRGYNPNYYFNLVNPENKRSILAKVSYDGQNIETLPHLPSKMFIRSKNREQTFVLDALLDPNINLVCISGKAGTGKTLLAVAAGYFLTEVEDKYDRLLVSRPVYPMGKDLGFLPGTLEEKLDPWMQPIYDSFDVINGNRNSSGKKLVADSSKITVEPLTYIRGRSIHRQFVIVDESQNLTPLEIKTIVTRAGEGTKIVLTGDVEQIDNPYVDKYSNGLSVVMDAFKDSSLSAHIIMTKGVRSKLAQEASKRI